MRKDFSSDFYSFPSWQGPWVSHKHRLALKSTPSLVGIKALFIVTGALQCRNAMTLWFALGEIHLRAKFWIFVSGRQILLLNVIAFKCLDWQIFIPKPSVLFNFWFASSGNDKGLYFFQSEFTSKFSDFLQREMIRDSIFMGPRSPGPIYVSRSL